jgi:dimethylargininase
LIFTGAIVRAVPRTIDAGITSANLGKQDYERACEQHDRYVGALEKCGLKVTVLEADERYPDSVFIEDTVVVTDRCAIAANPGAASRRGEVHEVDEVLSGLYEDVDRIVSPGTLDGGDVLQVGDHFYVGLTRRTNREGAEQLSEVLRRHGFTTSFVELRRFLHLKTGVAYLGGNDLVVAGELAANGEFEGFDKIFVPPEEEYCANCIRVNDYVLVAGGCERTKEKIVERGYEVIELAMSEFRKVDGGLSCLSLRLAGPGTV